MRMEAELRKLGDDIAIARKKRRFTQQRLAEGAGVNVATIRRLEKGDGGVALSVLAMVLLTLGENGRLSKLMDIASDDIGLARDVAQLPKRVRPKGTRRPRPDASEIQKPEAADTGQPVWF
ncbi:Helix-turn-helix domain-containing protein [Faunimonas pinastri]|uniref:Helix-turn-helix domain-containing protein n=1 Tax=Faunimonas pinastri TaxID=1855383 RepID=A0A1H9JMW9_9HYPH|nr:helix-turn-helix domain-containing protein [Faunimonas pinastri]SEQ88281.1 Helix-turn-helix domain-containing protein [Faunimonas pinastri]